MLQKQNLFSYHLIPIDWSYWNIWSSLSLTVPCFTIWSVGGRISKKSTGAANPQRHPPESLSLPNHAALLFLALGCPFPPHSAVVGQSLSYILEGVTLSLFLRPISKALRPSVLRPLWISSYCKRDLESSWLCAPEMRYKALLVCVLRKCLT